MQTNAMEMNDFEATIAFLAKHPIEHAALLALARRAQSTISLRRQFQLAHTASGEICGVMFTGPQTILSHADQSAVVAFAQLVGVRRTMRALIGPDATIEMFVEERKRHALSLPRVDMYQHLYALEALTLEPAFFSPHVAEATVLDLDAVVSGAGSMICEELGYDPRKRTTFRREILNQIQSRRWWIARDDELRLLCRIGATTMETMQLECIWSPPTSRGFGHATRSLATICAHLLKRRGTISLAVNATNERARKLYDRLGFVSHSSQRTLLW